MPYVLKSTGVALTMFQSRLAQQTTHNAQVSPRADQRTMRSGWSETICPITPFYITPVDLKKYDAAATELISQAPVPSDLVLSTATDPLHELVHNTGVRLLKQAEMAYQSTAQVILFLKSPEAETLGSNHPLVAFARKEVSMVIDSIGPTHGGVVARLSETMVEILKESTTAVSQGETLLPDSVTTIRSYLKVLMSEFPRKGREIMSSFEPYYLDFSETISRESAIQAIPHFAAVKEMWGDPRYFAGDRRHIETMVEHVRIGGALLGVEDLNPNHQVASDTSPHIILLNEAIQALKTALQLDDPLPGHTYGVAGNPRLMESVLPVLDGHKFDSSSQGGRPYATGGTEIWEWTANFRTAFLSTLIRASGAANDVMSDQPLFVPVHVVGEKCHADEARKGNSGVPIEDVEPFKQGVSTLQSQLSAFYTDISERMTSVLNVISS
jgi:hypothetical protein